MYNPLLDTNVRYRTWYEIAEELDHKIGWVAHKGRVQEAFKWINVLDLICTESAAYWRETGLDLYNGNDVKTHKNRLPQLAPQPSQDFDVVSII